jgi:Cu/Ag efflux protein CusF
MKIVDTNIVFVTLFLAIGIGITNTASAQDVQGMGSAKTQSIEQGTSGTSETLRGQVVAVDQAAGTVSINLSGAVGSNNSANPISFKVQGGRIPNMVKPGDKVSFSAERIGEETTITKLTRDQ